MLETLKQRIGMYVALVAPRQNHPSADEVKDEIVRRKQLGETYVGGLGFVRQIKKPEPVKYQQPDSLDNRL